MTDKDILKRLLVLEDLEKIRVLQKKYISHIDNLEFRKCVDIFTDDATAELRDSGLRKGKAEIEDLYINRLGKRTIRHDAHLTQDQQIVIKEESATGRWITFIFFSVPTVQWVQGINDMEYVKTGGEWKISKMKFTRILSSDPSQYP